MEEATTQTKVAEVAEVAGTMMTTRVVGAEAMAAEAVEAAGD